MVCFWAVDTVDFSFQDALKNKSGNPMRVRLEGGLYRKDFDATDFKPKAQSDYLPDQSIDSLAFS